MYDEVSKWIHEDIFKYEYIIFPIFDRDRKHWCLAISLYPGNVLEKDVDDKKK